jgi:hypothetical protein
MEIKTINPTNSKYIQAALNVVGNGLPYKILSLNDGIYDIDTPLKMNDGTIIKSTIEGSKNVIFRLIDKASIKQFGINIPIFGQKNSTIKDIEISGINFNGNKENQIVKWGLGYHNFIYLQRATNIYVHDIEVHHSLGDGLRVRNSNNISFKDSVIDECGHDGFHSRNSENIVVDNLTIRISIDSGVRLINSNHVKVSKINIIGFDRWDAGNPGILIEHSGNTIDDDRYSDDIEICDCTIRQTYGAGIWIVNHGKFSANKEKICNLYIHDCDIIECGLNPNINYVGGVVYAGWDNVLIENCLISNCYGYGIVALVPSGTTPLGKDYTLTANNCLIIKTQNSRNDESNGIGIACLAENHSVTITCSKVCGNIKNYKNVMVE